MSGQPDYQEVLQFWFEEIEPKQWWEKSSSFDKLIRDRFSQAHKLARYGELFYWRASPGGRLAEVIVLDQFSRNMFRDTARSFAYDPLALVLAQEAVAHGADRQVSEEQRPFFYLPYMHSESLLIHDVAVQLYKNYGQEKQLNFEQRHRDIIEQFGRYPHRNEVLGRSSTKEELEFLQQPGSSF